MWIALFPLIYPITCATEYFGGIDKHVDVIRQQMPFLHPTLPLLGQTPQHVPQVVPQAAIQGLAAILRDENDVILTLPFRVV